MTTIAVYIQVMSDSQLAPTKWQAGCWSLLVVFFALFLSPVARGAEYLVPLKWTVAPQGFSYVAIVDTVVDSPFAKEPSGVASVRRGKMSLGSKPREVITYLWGKDGTLRLDVNRNGDLTDDPGGLYQTKQRSESWGYTSATFANVMWPLKRGADTNTLWMDLNLWESTGRHGSSASQRSYYSGKLALSGKEWEIGLLQLPGMPVAESAVPLVIRPWAQRDEGFSSSSPFTDVVRVDKRVFFDGHCFEVATSESGGAPALTFNETPAAVGELTFTGSHVERVVLENPDVIAILDSPGKSIKVPVGRYKNMRVRLGSGAKAAYREISNANRETVIAANHPFVLSVGGPLTNSVRIDPRGPAINLAYSLVGTGRETYAFNDQSRTNPPRYAIYEGTKKVASGNFEYG